jgi:hypothetical protein
MKQLLILLVMSQLGACQWRECNELTKLVQSDKNVSTLEVWADSAVFDRTFERGDLGDTGLVGPGRYGLRGDIGIIPPSQNFAIPENWSIRLLGSDFRSPEGIFIGQRSYLGIIVARTDLRATLKSARIQITDFENGRVAVMCGRDEL